MNKGFTLIELLAILVILSVITLVAVPNVIRNNEHYKDKECEEFMETLTSAAEVYVETKDPKNRPQSGSVNVQELQDLGLLNKNIINMCDENNKPLSNPEKIIINYNKIGKPHYDYSVSGLG